MGSVQTSDADDNLRRLHWQCRRGMLELDHLLSSLLEQHYADFSPGQQDTFQDLLKESDQDLLQWFLGQGRPQRADFQKIIDLIRNPANSSHRK